MYLYVCLSISLLFFPSFFFCLSLPCPSMPCSSSCSFPIQGFGVPAEFWGILRGIPVPNRSPHEPGGEMQSVVAISAPPLLLPPPLRMDSLCDSGSSCCRCLKVILSHDHTQQWYTALYLAWFPWYGEYRYLPWCVWCTLAGIYMWCARAQRLPCCAEV